MNRRQFIQGGLASVAALTPAFATAEVKVYDNQNISRGLGLLKDGETGQPFRQARGQYVLAYFGTAHKQYKGCGENLLQMYDTHERAKIDYNLDVQPVLVYPPIEPERGRGLLDRYVRGIHDMHFVGLTADHETVKRVGLAHKVYYKFEEGKTTFHNKAAVLISPDGALLRKYTQEDKSFGRGGIKNDIIADVMVPDIYRIEQQRRGVSPSRFLG